MRIKSFLQLFMPMWTVLLTIIGYASYRVWLLGNCFSSKTIVSFVFYSITLIANWTIVFYGPTNLNLVTIHQAVSFLVASLTAVLFFRIDKVAGLLFLPYIYWLLFLAFLNYHMWIMNADGEWFANRDNRDGSGTHNDTISN